jgi:hypothetical protein
MGEEAQIRHETALILVVQVVKIKKDYSTFAAIGHRLTAQPRQA